MSLRTWYTLSGYLSILIGIAAFVFTYMKFLYYGISLSILGYILAVINIFLNQKYYSDQEKYPKGYLGMLLSSLPVLFIVVLFFKFGK
jgi:hypothetical protein